jgi:hypothetical protein
MLSGEAPDDIARRWNTRRGTILDAVPHDVPTLNRIRDVRSRLSKLNE